MTPIAVNRAEHALDRRVFAAALGRAQLRWLNVNVPGFAEARVELGQWRTRVMLERYRRGLAGEAHHV